MARKGCFNGGKRKFILMEMGEYFDTILKPRVIKAAFSDEWKDGKPGTPAGDSHIVRYHTLEQYEDALNNIVFNNAFHQGALDLFQNDARDEYVVGYMLDLESRDSATLLNIEHLRHPFGYDLLLADGAGASPTPTVVDLPSTFAHLLGLRVQQQHTAHDDERRYLIQRGTLPDGGRAVVVWRDLDNIDLQRDARFLAQFAEDGVALYVNGDCTLPGVQILDGIFKLRMEA